MPTIKKLVNLLIFSILLGFALPQIVSGIGQMTKPIIFESVLRGQEIETILNLYNSEDKEILYGLNADGDIKAWTTFFAMDNLENPITKIKIPAQSRVDAIAKFNVPNDTPNGAYAGQVAIVTLLEEEENKEGLSVSVGSRVGRDVSITVTDKEIINFQTTIIPLKYGVSKGEPLKIKVIYENKGNIAIKPDIQLKITKIDSGNVVLNVIYPYPEGENPVKPFERKEFPNLIDWSTAGQENGKYKAEMKVLLNGKSSQEESFRFDVGVNVETLLASVAAIFGGGNLILAWFVIGIILLLIVGSLALIYKKSALLKAGVNKLKNLF
jgi:uncharacterized membrane protein